MSLQPTPVPPAEYPFPSLAAGSRGRNGAPKSANGRPALTRRKGKTRKLLLAGALVALTFAGSVAVQSFVAGHHPQRTDVVTHTVGYEPIQVTVVERGALEAAENRDVVCQVKAGAKGATAATTIKWVIDDGTPVKRGQLLLELDDSGFQDQLTAEAIVLDQARSAWVQADENYKIVESQNKSDLKTAEIALELAKLDLVKYLQGDYQQALKDVLGRTSMAESDLDMRRDRAAWAQRMVRKGYLTTSQAQAEQALLESARIALDKVLEERRVLDRFTYVRTKTDLESKIAEAQRAVDRVKQQAAAKEVQAHADRQSKRFVYDQELGRYHEIEDEIKKCTITSPQDGLVVYYVPEQARSGSGFQQSILAQGEPVREGQKLMRIPDLSKMQVNTRVHEAMMSRVRGEQVEPTGFGDSVRAALLTPPGLLTRLAGTHAFAALREHFQDKEKRKVTDGQPALVRVDAYPDRVLHGHVKSVATVASQQDWWSSDVKVYQTLITLGETFDGLKPGMSAEVTIIADQEAEPVLAVPVQALVGPADQGKYRKCFVMTPDGPVARDVAIGLTNEKMAEIEAGLAEGDEVVLNPRTILAEHPREKPAKGQGKAGSAAPSTNRRQSGNASKKTDP
jgi:multidrug efflux pump subunit AcrA (membrane-fusion protein)